MFPLKANDPYIKETGERSTLGSVVGGGGGSSALPEYTEADAGKVLGVTEEGELAWVTVSGVSNYAKVTSSIIREDPNVDIKEGE